MGVGVGEGRRCRVLKETNRKRGTLGSGKNLAQGTLPGMYKDEPAKTPSSADM